MRHRNQPAVSLRTNTPIVIVPRGASKRRHHARAAGERLFHGPSGGSTTLEWRVNDFFTVALFNSTWGGSRVISRLFTELPMSTLKHLHFKYTHFKRHAQQRTYALVLNSETCEAFFCLLNRTSWHCCSPLGLRADQKSPGPVEGPFAHHDEHWDCSHHRE
jgi:hypothetical protein